MRSIAIRHYQCTKHSVMPRNVKKDCYSAMMYALCGKYDMNGLPFMLYTIGGRMNV